MLKNVARLARWAGIVLLVATGIAPLQAKDGVVELLGPVQAMPASGLTGDWTIASRAVRTDAATLIKQELGRIGVGATVEVKGADAGGGVVLATTIEVKQGVPGSLPPIGGGNGLGEFTGAIESMPAAGLLGTWRIAGRTVIAVSATRLQQELGGFRVGAIVEVHGLVGASGSVTASKIEVKGGGGTPVPPGAGADLEIVGTIDALPAAGLLGDWRVGGRLVRVAATTVLDVEHGAFEVGVPVEVHGIADAVGALLATRIERTAGNGAPTPAAMFWGSVDAMPGPATAPIGLWQIGGRVVSVSASTAIRQNDGPLGLGAIVEVKGWLQGDGVVLAHEIETRRAIGAVPGQASAAVEYVNDRLGHYFVTAFPAEIAALDAGAFGGAWRRTGQSFNVGGGAAAVCRFYGMPPKGPDSHFFTVDAVECEKVMRDYRAWTYEAHAFSVSAPVGGACAAGQVPVTRFFNNAPSGADMNHRYVVNPQVSVEMRGRGWIEEGVVMCARP